MKIATIAFGALPFLQLAAAQPHRARHAHQNMHVKRDENVVVTVIDTVYAEPTGLPDVMVIVNQFGVVLSTITEGMYDSVPKFWSTAHGSIPSPLPAPATSSPEPTPTTLATVPSSVQVVTSSALVVTSPALAVTSSALVVTSPVQAVTSSAPVIASPASVVASPAAIVEAASVAAPIISIAVPSTSVVATTPPAAETESSSSSSTGNGYGFSYSPYNPDNSCKTQDQILTDFEKIGDGYSLVRIYGVDCNQTATVLTAAKKYNLKLFAGIFSLGNLNGDVQTISDAANGDWSSFDTVSVGNELVNSGSATPDAVVAAIGTVRGLLKTAGYTGKVVTVDTLVAARANPSLCDASDVCTVNSHPFFDGNVAANGAGDFLTTQIPTLQAVLANKNQKIVISETGWPSQGNSNGAAVPSPSNQADAISAIKSAFSTNPSGVILFTAFNTLWKTNTAAQFDAEQYWGFLGTAPTG